MDKDSGLIIGIDASRARSGGAKAHIIGILSAGINPIYHGIDEVHLWSYKDLLESIPDQPWLVKHTNTYLEKSIFHQIYWQLFLLPTEARVACIDIMLYTDASAFVRFYPCITMSRDMLSFEKGEIDRFGLSLSRVRLVLIKYIQKMSLKKSDGVIFLTKYASNIIQKYTGKIDDFKIIPHGVSKDFKVLSPSSDFKIEVIKCIYVSDASYYKHQWHVISAISILRKKGYNLLLELVGAGSGVASGRVISAIEKYDPNEEFVSVLKFVNHSEIPVLLSNSDIYIFASSCENMPNTLIEGMASGLPIACSNRGPMPEVLRNGGVYFNPENPDSISDAVEKIITDKSLRDQISVSAKQNSEDYSWFRCGTETFQYLSEVHKRNI